MDASGLLRFVRGILTRQIVEKVVSNMFQHVLETTFILISAADKRSLATQRRRRSAALISGGAAQLIRADLWFVMTAYSLSLSL